ncbi:hypothetical protein GGQ99_000961 [Aminobacter niigataensis]|uniref:Uncharacterized protein n=1 Tax=Aminobacter niigataensis TaxID=83265 RepID=A0ABR6KXJ5_9HYPH|nr:hypothetical protein [Aminobacter niigataensis]
MTGIAFHQPSRCVGCLVNVVAVGQAHRLGRRIDELERPACAGTRVLGSGITAALDLGDDLHGGRVDTVFCRGCLYRLVERPREAGTACIAIAADRRQFAGLRPPVKCRLLARTTAGSFGPAIGDAAGFLGQPKHRACHALHELAARASNGQQPLGQQRPGAEGLVGNGFPTLVCHQ